MKVGDSASRIRTLEPADEEAGEECPNHPESQEGDDNYGKRAFHIMKIAEIPRPAKPSTDLSPTIDNNRKLL